MSDSLENIYGPIADVKRVYYSIDGDIITVSVNHEEGSECVLKGDDYDLEDVNYADHIRQLPALEDLSILVDLSEGDVVLDDDLLVGLKLSSIRLINVTANLRNLLEPVADTLTRLELIQMDITSLDEVQLPLLEYLSLTDCVYNKEEALYLNDCPNLKEIHIYRCDLVLLPEFQDCTKLEIVNVERTDLSKDNLSTYDLSKLTNMLEFSIADTDIRGTITDDFNRMTSLKRLDLSGNQLTGQLPKDLSGLSNVEDFYVSFNQLEGSLAPLAALTNAGRIFLPGNKFKGPIPNALLENNSRLELMDITQNEGIKRLPSVKAASRDLHVHADSTIQVNQQYWILVHTEYYEGRTATYRNREFPL